MAQLLLPSKSGLLFAAAAAHDSTPIVSAHTYITPGDTTTRERGVSSALTKTNLNLPTVPYVVSTPALLAGLDLLERAALRLHDAAVDEDRDEQVRDGVPAE